jgi:hypothetical protein
MDKLSIKLHDDKTVFAPRDTIRGVIEWNLDSNPRRLDLSLFWYTAGRGTRDVGMVHQIPFDNPGMRGSKEFSFSLPDGPLSVSGKLVSIIWAIELTCSSGSETARREIVLSSTGKEILLGSVPSRNPFASDPNDSRPNSPESILRPGG